MSSGLILRFQNLAAQASCSAEISRMDAEIVAVKEKMAELKKKLYAKFGDSINLEES